MKRYIYPRSLAGVALLWATAVMAADGPDGGNHAPRFERTQSFDLPPVEAKIGVSPGVAVPEMIGKSVVDPDKNAQLGIAVTAVDNSNGRWQYSLDRGESWSDFGKLNENTATLIPAIPSAKLRFTPDKEYQGTAEIKFRAWDQTFGKPGDTGVDASQNGGNSAFSDSAEKGFVEIKPLQKFDKHELEGRLLELKSPTKGEVDRVVLELLRRGLSVNEATELLNTVKQKNNNCS